MEDQQQLSGAQPAQSLADMIYDVLKTAARPMPAPVVANRIRITQPASRLSEQELMQAVDADPRLRRHGSGHLMLAEWEGRRVG